jgi:hypothetical protein
MAAGSVTRPKDSEGAVWDPEDFGSDSKTQAFPGYKLGGRLLTTFSTAPYAQGCFWACLTSSYWDETYKQGCESWTYQKSTKKCFFYKEKAYVPYNAKNPSCVTWEKASSDFVSGWLLSSYDSPSDYKVCK